MHHPLTKGARDALRSLAAFLDVAPEQDAAIAELTRAGVFDTDRPHPDRVVLTPFGLVVLLELLGRERRADAGDELAHAILSVEVATAKALLKGEGA